MRSASLLAGALMQQRFEGNAKSLTSGAKATKLSAGLERKTDLLVGLATALVLYVGARRALAGALTAGELVVFLTYLKAAFKPMRDLAKYTGRIAQAGASAERIADLLQVSPDIVDAPGARPADPFKGEIEFRDVWLAYEPGRMVLRDISLHIPAGQRVALVGPSGAGKSSLAMLVSRLGDPTQGEIRIDGQDLRDLTVDSVRRSSRWCSRRRCCSPRPSGTTSRTGCRHVRGGDRGRRPAGGGTTSSCGASGTTPSSAGGRDPVRRGDSIAIARRRCATRRSSSSTRP
jgi:ABC-type multidrug transport system fused ATPase/permease subunit